MSASSPSASALSATGRSASSPKLRFTPSLTHARYSSSSRFTSVSPPRSVDITHTVRPASGTPARMSMRISRRGRTMCSSMKSIRLFTSSDTGSSRSSAAAAF